MMTADTSAMLLETIGPITLAYAKMPESENQPAPAVHDSRPLSTVDPSVQTVTTRDRTGAAAGWAGTGGGRGRGANIGGIS